MLRHQRALCISINTFFLRLPNLLSSELKEQLLARSSHVDDIECLKVEFNEQKKEIKEQNEAELENLRRYWSTDMGLHKKLYINCRNI